jgi:glucose-6-phosphate isomerase, archaeal
MINLLSTSGLPIELDDQTFKLKFNLPLSEVIPTARTLKEMQNVCMDPKATSDRDELYYMYRDVHLPEDEKIIRENKVRYDITVIPPAMIGEEFTKTYGHYHSLIPGEEYAYPEVYEVLHGEALFLIQKLDKEGKVNTVLAIPAKEGEQVIYPPNYGHIIINLSDKVLVTGNWVSSEYAADYNSIAEKRGMAYYVVKGKGKNYDLVPNKNYGELPELRYVGQNVMDLFGFTVPDPMYTTAIKKPQMLEFLNNPHKYAVQLSAISS